MVNLLRHKKTIQTEQTKWFVYKGGENFEKLPIPPTFGQETKGIFLLLEKSPESYLLRLHTANGKKIIGGERRSSNNTTFNYDWNYLLEVARDKNA